MQETCPSATEAAFNATGPFSVILAAMNLLGCPTALQVGVICQLQTFLIAQGTPSPYATFSCHPCPLSFLSPPLLRLSIKLPLMSFAPARPLNLNSHAIGSMGFCCLCLQR